MATDHFLDAGSGASPPHKYEDDDDDAGGDVLVAVKDEEHSPPPSPSSANKKPKRKREGATSQLRKAPQAPKRFKSSYICFFMAKQPVIKAELGDKATVTAISKRSAEMWKNLPPEERAHWDDVAAKDKQRYMVEKATYTGPWQVPWKRAKKDPSAPKRPMSAFLYFAQGRRTRIKNENPEMKNTEISRILGEMWRGSTDEEKRVHVEREKTERAKYKIAVAKWKEESEAERNKAAQTEAPASGMMAIGGGMPAEQQQQQHMVPPPPMMAFQDPYGNQVAAPHGQPGPYMYSQYPQYQMPPSIAPYPFPTNGKAVILGPSGQPHNYSSNQQQQSADQHSHQQQQMSPQQQYSPQHHHQHHPGNYEDSPVHHHHHQPPYGYSPDPADGEPQAAS